MPSLPEYGGLKVATQPLGAPQAPAAAFGVPHQSLDLSGVAKVAGDMASEAKQQADQVAVSAADASIVRAKTARLWHPETGAMNARGKDAIPASDAAQQGFQKDAADIEATLSNDQQKEAFSRRVDMHYADLGGQLGQHVATQIKQYDADTTNGHADALTDAAMKGYQDGGTVQRSIDDTRAVLTDYWRRNGHSNGDGIDDFAQQHIASRVSAIRSAVLKQFAQDGQDKQAAQYFAAHKDEFVGKDYVTSQKLVDTGNAQGEGRNLADQILGISQADPLPGDQAAQQHQKRTPTMTDALTQADKIADPEQRKAATDAIVSHYTHLETAGRLDREAAAARVTSRLETSGGRLNKADPDFQMLVGHPEEEHVLHRQDQLLRPAKDPGDPDAFLAHLNMASVNPASQQAFLQMDFTGKDGDGMNTGQKTRLIQMQRSMRTQADRTDDVQERRDAAASQTHAVQAEQIRFDREKALLKVGDPASTSYIPDKVDRDKEVSRLKTHFDQLERAHHINTPVAKGVGSGVGFMPLDAPAASPHARFDPLAGHLSVPAHASLDEWPARPLTAQMIEDIQKKGPRYAKYLDSINVVVPRMFLEPRKTP